MSGEQYRKNNAWGDWQEDTQDTAKILTVDIFEVPHGRLLHGVGEGDGDVRGLLLAWVPLAGEFLENLAHAFFVGAG